MTKASETLRELARYQKAAAPDETAWVMAHTDFAALADEVERLEALRTYAQHDALCSYRPTYPDAPVATCDCGFDAALAAAERQEEDDYTGVPAADMTTAQYQRWLREGHPPR